MPDTAINADPRRERLIAALQANDAYTFLALIGSYLNDVPDDDEALEWAVKTCATMRLFSHGQRLLAFTNPRDSVRDRLAPLIAGRDQRIAWSQLRERFQTNLTVFDEQTGLGETVDALWRASASKLQLLTTADGCLQVFSRLPDAPGWLPALASHHANADADALRKDWEKRIICPLALNGIGLGYTASALIEASRESFLDFSAPLFLIEPSLLAWAVVMHLHDWRQAFAEPRVHICAGERALGDFQHALDDAEIAVPALINGGPQWPGALAQSSVEAVVKSFAASRQEAQASLYERVCRKTAARDRAWWADRYANAGNSGPPLTVLGVTSRFTTVLQYTMRDLLAAFNSMGCRTHLIIERDASSYFSPTRTLQAIDEHDPDLIVNIDHLQAEYPNLYPTTIPGMCWIQDQLPHLFNPQAGRNVRPLEFVAGHGFPEALLKFNYPADRFRPCLIPTDPDQMLDANETDEDLAPYRCDVMYATNASSPPDKFYETYRNRASEPVRPLLDAVFESLSAVIAQPQFSGDYDYAGLLEQAEADTGIQISDAASRADVIGTLMRGVADITLRERTVRAAARWADQSGGKFHLYGHGWDERPEFARFAKGFVKHGPELGRAFRAATISLHAGTNSALHQRVLDGLCAGGFFLIQEKPSDAENDVPAAVLRFYRENRPAFPFRLKAEHLPEPYAGRARRVMRMRGVDPNDGDLQTQDTIIFNRAHHELGFLRRAAAVWPRYDQVVFRDPEHLVERIEFFLQHSEQRRELAREMRAAVLANFTYAALVRNVLAFVQDGLSGRGKSLLE